MHGSVNLPFTMGKEAIVLSQSDSATAQPNRLYCLVVLSEWTNRQLQELFHYGTLSTTVGTEMAACFSRPDLKNAQRDNRVVTITPNTVHIEMFQLANRCDLMHGQ